MSTRVRSSVRETITDVGFDEVSLWDGLADVTFEVVCSIETDIIEPEGTYGFSDSFREIESVDVLALTVWFDGPNVPPLPMRLKPFAERWHEGELKFWLFKLADHERCTRRHFPREIVAEVVAAVGGNDAIEDKLN